MVSAVGSEDTTRQTVEAGGTPQESAQGSGKQGAGGTRPTSDPPQWPSGIGGWLVLPIIGLFFMIYAQLVYLIRDELPLVDSDTLSSLIFIIFVRCVLVIYSVALLVLMFRKHWVLPRLMIVYYAFFLLLAIVDGVILLVWSRVSLVEAGLIQEGEIPSTNAIRELVGAGLAAVIWIPYFLFSRRVRNTFRRTSPARAVASGPTATTPHTTQRQGPMLPPAHAETRSDGRSSQPELPVTPQRPIREKRLGSAIGLSFFAVVVLVTLGVLAWRSVDLSRQVGELSHALTSTTTISSTTTSGSTTTTVDPWKGNRLRYGEMLSEFFRKMAGLTQKRMNLKDKSANAEAKATLSDILPLALYLDTFPAAPKNVQDAQDQLFDGLMDLHAAAVKVSQDNSKANVEAYQEARDKEWRLVHVWLREFGRAQ